MDTATNALSVLGRYGENYCGDRLGRFVTSEGLGVTVHVLDARTRYGTDDVKITTPGSPCIWVEARRVVPLV